MKILITGAKGMLAQAVRERFMNDPAGQENEIILTDRSVEAGAADANGKNEIKQADGKSLALDITNFAAVKNLISEVKPDLIINCAAFTNVDAAEQAKEAAEKVNALGPENLAKAAAEVETESGEKGAILVHISTDYVFGGVKPVQKTAAELIETPEKFIYSEDDEKAPQSVYGKTKLQGEEVIARNCQKYYIFRTAWLYGHGGKNFVETMKNVAATQIEAVKNGEKDFAEVTVVDDQHGSPTFTDDLTEIIYQAVYNKIPFGIYNATNAGFTTWADFTKKIYELLGINCIVRGISSEEYEAATEKKAAEKGEKRVVAPRPKNSQMSKQKLREAGVEIPEWTDALKRYLGV